MSTDLSKFTIRQLLALYDAHAAAADAYLSILAQPRAEDAVYGLAAPSSCRPIRLLKPLDRRTRTIRANVHAIKC